MLRFRLEAECLPPGVPQQLPPEFAQVPPLVLAEGLTLGL